MPRPSPAELEAALLDASAQERRRLHAAAGRTANDHVLKIDRPSIMAPAPMPEPSTRSRPDTRTARIGWSAAGLAAAAAVALAVWLDHTPPAPPTATPAGEVTAHAAPGPPGHERDRVPRTVRLPDSFSPNLALSAWGDAVESALPAAPTPITRLTARPGPPGPTNAPSLRPQDLLHTLGDAPRTVFAREWRRVGQDLDHLAERFTPTARPAEPSSRLGPATPDRPTQPPRPV